MNNAQFLDRVMDRLGRRKSTDLRANVVLELQIKKAEYETGATLPWWLESIPTLGPTTQGLSGFTLPTNLIREMEDGAVRVLDPDDGTEYYPRKKSYSDVQAQTVAGVLGPPQIYAIFGDSIYFAPLMAKAYTFIIPGYYSSPDLTDDTSALTGWYKYAPQLMLCGVVAVVAETPLQNYNLSNLYRQREVDQKAILWRSIEARLNANRDVEIGEDEETTDVP